MEIHEYSRDEALQFDQEWRAALRAQHLQRSSFGHAELPVWRERAKHGVAFAQDGGSASGTVTFEPDEEVPHPAELCDELGLDSVWFFGEDYDWAIRTGHDDWKLAEAFERPADAGLLS